MVSTIKKLDRDVSLRLRSQVFVASIPWAVREIVQNSVDADASDVKVTVDLTSLSFVVTDDGKGIHPDDLSLIGSQYCTSKLDNLEELKGISTYGFRGEALHSISKVSHTVLITKSRDYNATWERVLYGDNSIRMFEGKKNFFGVDVMPYTRDTSGCTVIVGDMMHNLPVRRKILLSEPHYRIFSQIKEDIFQILVQHPTMKISVSFKAVTGEYKKLLESPGVYHSRKSEVLTQLLRNVFGSVVPSNTLKSISLTFKKISINGLISKCPMRIRNIQFIYINGRRYKDEGFLKAIDSLFRSAGYGYGGQIVTSVKSVGTPHRFYPLFVLDIKSPQNINDLVQNPSKLVITPTFQNVINPLIMKTLNSFLILQGYTTPSTLLTRGSSKGDLPSINSTDEFSEQGSSNLTALRSTPVTRTRLHLSKIRAARLKDVEILGRFDALQQQVAPKPTFKPPLFGTTYGIPQLTSRKNSRSGDWLDIPNSCTRQMGGCSHFKVKYSNHETNIERLQLRACSVIGQLDKKFILLKVPATTGVDVDNSMKLFILDQHACDERIKLESFLQDFICNALNNSLFSQPIVENPVDITTAEAHLFEHYSREMRKWSIFYSIKEEETGSFRITIESLPDILLERYKKDTTFLKDALLQHFTELEMRIRNTLPNPATHREELKSTKWWKCIDSIPTVIREVLNSKACRSAIMFGDSLTTTECSILVKKLSNCHNPFYCAHGRPSVVPLTELQTTSLNAHPYIQQAADYLV